MIASVIFDADVKCGAAWATGEAESVGLMREAAVVLLEGEPALLRAQEGLQHMLCAAVKEALSRVDSVVKKYPDSVRQPRQGRRPDPQLGGLTAVAFSTHGGREFQLHLDEQSLLSVEEVPVPAFDGVSASPTKLLDFPSRPRRVGRAAAALAPRDDECLDFIGELGGGDIVGICIQDLIFLFIRRIEGFRVVYSRIGAVRLFVVAIDFSHRLLAVLYKMRVNGARTLTRPINRLPAPVATHFRGQREQQQQRARADERAESADARRSSPAPTRAAEKRDTLGATKT
mmetsp:Transcript_142/g.571  ORF Transcript_142/g.571 Transcript_142/m.571 type:complete len:287 (+) Transcript_142:329-1189(+)